MLYTDTSQIFLLFTIVTDHQPLLGRWSLELDPYDWVNMHKSGARQTNVDGLSCRPDPNALQMVYDVPGATHTLVDTGTQMPKPDGPGDVCAIDTPTTTPATDLSSNPRYPPDLQAPTDQA